MSSRLRRPLPCLGTEDLTHPSLLKRPCQATFPRLKPNGVSVSDAGILFGRIAYYDRPRRTCEPCGLFALLNTDQPGRASDTASFLAAVGHRTFLTVHDAATVAVDFALQHWGQLKLQRVRS